MSHTAVAIKRVGNMSYEVRDRFTGEFLGRVWRGREADTWHTRDATGHGDTFYKAPRYRAIALGLMGER